MGLEVFLDKVPTFGIGATDSYRSGDEGWGPRPIPGFEGDRDLSWHLIEHLVARGVMEPGHARGVSALPRQRVADGRRAGLLPRCLIRCAWP